MGIEFSAEDVMLAGERIYNLERYYNNLAGFREGSDVLPQRFTHEPSTLAGSKGHVCELDLMLAEYYQARGWNDAVVAESKLKELGILEPSASGDGREKLDAVVAQRERGLESALEKHAATPVDEDMGVSGQVPRCVEYLAAQSGMLEEHPVQQLPHAAAVWEIEVEVLAAHDVPECGIEINPHRRMLPHRRTPRKPGIPTQPKAFLGCRGASPHQPQLQL